MMNTAIAFIVYKRPDTTRRVFETIRKARPPRLYLIADGPKTPDLESRCREVRQIVENGIDWDCELRPVYSHKNLGLARRVQTGLDEVFSREKAAVILEEDTVPNDSFFRFCEELLLRYANDHRVAHISGCNLHSESFASSNSYSLCSIVNIWGWATWARAWQSFDLRMESWNSAPQVKCSTNGATLERNTKAPVPCSTYITKTNIRGLGPTHGYTLAGVKTVSLLFPIRI